MNASYSDVITVPLFFLPPPPPPLSYNPQCPPPWYNWKSVAVMVRRGISKRSHKKIGDCEQSTLCPIGEQHLLRYFLLFVHDGCSVSILYLSVSFTKVVCARETISNLLTRDGKSLSDTSSRTVPIIFLSRKFCFQPIAKCLCSCVILLTCKDVKWLNTAPPSSQNTLYMLMIVFNKNNSNICYLYCTYFIKIFICALQSCKYNPYLKKTNIIHHNHIW